VGGAYAVPGVGSVGKGRGGGEGGGWGEVDGDFASSTKVRSLLSAALSLARALSLLTPFPPPTPYFSVCVFQHQFALSMFASFVCRARNYNFLCK